MRLAAPAVPKDWQLQRLPDGSARATITRQPVGWVAGLFLALALPFLSFLIFLASSGLLMWTIALALLLALLVHLIDRIVHGALGTEAWHFSDLGLSTRKTVLGITWWNADYFRGTLSIASEESGIWDLRFQDRGDLYSLFRSDALDDVLGMAAFLEEELGWPLQVPENVPMFFRQAVENALAAHDEERIRLLLQDERSVAMLARECGPLYRRRLREILTTLEAETALLTGIAEQAGPEARAGAVELLGELDDLDALPVLRRALADSSGQVRVRAAQALGRRRDMASVPALCAALQYAPDLRGAAVYALGEIGDGSALDALAALLVGPGRIADAAGRQLTLRALGQLKDPAAIPILAVAVRDTEPAVRETAADVLGIIGGSAAVAPLASALADPAERVALRAVMSLGRIRDPRALQALADALTDDRFELRASAARALALIGDEVAVQALCRALNDPAEAVRYEAAAGLQRVVKHRSVMPIQIRAVLPLLRRLCSPLSTEPADVKYACHEAIQQIERATASVKQLPLPANGLSMEPEFLPLPANQIALGTGVEAAEWVTAFCRYSDCNL